jgi:hypothetical protein
MAIPKVKTTYALDRDTVHRLERMARQWGVSKSEALRRAIRAAASLPNAAAVDAATALEELQRSLHLSPADAEAWVRRARAERRAATARHEGRDL